MCSLLRWARPWLTILLLVLFPAVSSLAESLSVRVGHVDDDAEEPVSDGIMYLESSDLELIDEEGFREDQIVGVRFLNVTIPPGAPINSAYIDFTTDETSSVATSVVFRGEDAADAARFTATVDNISDRATTTASVSWNSIPAWNTVGEVHTTPDLASVVQEIVDRGDWSSGNAMVFIVTGSGVRVAESYDGSPTQAPLLRVDYTVISGRVFEDADFAGTASDYDGGANDLALANVDVELYDNTDTYISSTITDGSGNFSFPVADGTYKIRARTATIGDSNTLPYGGFNAACGITDPVSGLACVTAEQTWGNGAAYGGQSATADDTTTDNDAGPGDTWVSVAVSGADVTGVNFGFAYNLIVNTNNSGQGSLDNFIDNANAIGSANGTTANSSEFRIPGTDPNFAAGVARISPTSALSPITDSGTAIDGTTQTSNNGNTNSAIFGTGGTVGVDALALTQVAGPEVEIRDAGGIDNGIQIQANNATVRGLAILGFGSGDQHGAIAVDDGFTGALIENNMLGSTAASFTDPGAALRNYNGVVSDGGDSGTIRDNLIGFGHRGVFLQNTSTGWTIEETRLSTTTWHRPMVMASRTALLRTTRCAAT